MPATLHPAAAVESAPASAAPAPFTRDEVKARAKAIKKQRKHEGRRLFFLAGAPACTRWASAFKQYELVAH